MIGDAAYLAFYYYAIINGNKIEFIMGGGVLII